MGIEQVYYLTEIVAVIVLVISVFYLAVQVKQNTDLARVNTAAGWVNWNTDMGTPIATDRVFAECWFAGESDFEDLDAIDQRRLIIFEWRALSAWHNYYRFYQEGYLAEQQWREMCWLFENLGRRQAVRASWKEFKGSFDPGFQRFMEQYLDERSGI